ncbi:MAG: TolC family protein [Bacteroidales bacterium]
MKYLKKTIIVFTILMGASSLFCFAQETVQHSMTIQQLSDSVVMNNIQLKLAGTSVAIANAQIIDVKMNRLPNIGTSMTAMYLGDITLLNTDFSKLQDVDIPNFGHLFNVTINEVIYAGGKINTAIDLAGLNKELRENQQKDAEQEIKLTAIQLYLSLYKLYHQKDILEGNNALANEQLKKVRLFYNQKIVTKNEVLRAEVQEGQLLQTILKVKNAIEITNKSLTTLAGLDENVIIIPNVDNLNHQLDLESETDFLFRVYQNNPQIAGSDIQIAMAEKSLKLTKANNKPVLVGFAQYELARPLTSSSPVLDYYSGSPQIGLSLSYNIESLFKNKKKEAVNHIQIDQAKQAKSNAMQQIDLEVDAAFKSYHQAIEQKQVLLKNEKVAAENYRITELKYQKQLVTIAEMIDASNTKLQAELQTLDAEMDIVLNYVKLLRLSGQL